uniref:Uncharacterized protein n=1 Tax=Mucochytrium quahogii TaxID=96639 RepID=A0A7S2WFR0_9STRA|mmetsp:Transcript_15941/g.26039  ORF Transcript_15941/g.26039 Transcript_15941/m.26039 type:complete len:161 (-) Transcript_15941:41-523(-)
MTATYITTGLAGLNLIAAILAMSLAWVTDGFTSASIWNTASLLSAAQLNVSKAFLVLSFIAALATLLLSVAALMQKTSWLGAFTGNVATAIFALISFATFVALPTGLSYGAGFVFEIVVIVLGLIGAAVSFQAYRKSNQANSAAALQGNPGQNNSPEHKV